jgi:hypothetical protein
MFHPFSAAVYPERGQHENSLNKLVLQLLK